MVVRWPAEVGGLAPASAGAGAAGGAPAPLRRQRRAGRAEAPLDALFHPEQRVSHRPLVIELLRGLAQKRAQFDRVLQQLERRARRQQLPRARGTRLHDVDERIHKHRARAQFPPLPRKLLGLFGFCEVRRGDRGELGGRGRHPAEEDLHEAPEARRRQHLGERRDELLGQVLVAIRVGILRRRRLLRGQVHTPQANNRNRQSGGGGVAGEVDRPGGRVGDRRLAAGERLPRGAQPEGCTQRAHRHRHHDEHPTRTAARCRAGGAPQLAGVAHRG